LVGMKALSREGRKVYRPDWDMASSIDTACAHRFLTVESRPCPVLRESGQ